MNTRQETWRVEEGMVCAEPSPEDRPPYGDLVALTPSEEHGMSAALWPERAARMVAAHNAFTGHDAENFAQLVEDALVFRWLMKDAEPRAQTDIEGLRDDYRNREQKET